MVEVKLIPLDQIKPNPYQPRESFDEESLETLAKSIRAVSLLQPVTVRPKDGKYELISGERRWRAAKKAGLKEIPAIVKDVDDARLMLESLIENVHREDLSAIARAKGLYSVYKFHGINLPPEVLASKLDYLKEEPRLSDELRKIKEIADLVGLSYWQQYEILSVLRLSPEERKTAEKKGIGITKLAPIARVEKSELRKKLIEIAPKKTEEEISKMAKIAREGPEPLAKAVLKGELEPEVAEKLVKVPERKIKAVIEEAKALRVTPEEAEKLAEAAETEMKIPAKRIKELLKSYREYIEEIEKKFDTPEFRRLSLKHRNLSAHWYVLGALEHLRCPVCDAGARENLVWKCHNLTIEQAVERLKRELSK